jgi:outer membrane protein OmpA-like peptidoglycan-associated protein
MSKFKNNEILVSFARRFFLALYFSYFLVSCGLVRTSMTENMGDEERLHDLMTKTDSQLCNFYNNTWSGEKTKKQVEKLLRERKIEKCDALWTTRLVPPDLTIQSKAKQNDSSVNCKTDADCDDGKFCWSVVGGGHECQVKAVTVTSKQSSDPITLLKSGKLRLTCTDSCEKEWKNGHKSYAKSLYDKELWKALATEVVSANFASNQTYYFLGRATEGLGDLEKAKTYYNLSLMFSNCGGVDDCDGLLFPDVVNAAIRRIEWKKTNSPENSSTIFTSENVSEPDHKKSPFVNPLDVKSLPKTISMEHTERMDSLNHLSGQLGIKLPKTQELQVKIASAKFPVPVIRFHFDERTFFDSGSSIVRPDSNKIIDMLAEQMKQDMPDTSLVILGHTDSVGSDEYNNDLSINRSASVMQQLAQRGVNLKQMSTVGIGEAQPVATNATEDGRSQNRRVEFVLSRFEEANYVAIEQFPRNTEWLNNHPERQVELEPIIQEKLPVKTKQVVHVQPKATPVIHHNTEAKKLIVFKPTKEMLTPSNPEKIIPPEPITMLKESTRTVTIIPAEIVHIIPSTQN